MEYGAAAAPSPRTSSEGYRVGLRGDATVRMRRETVEVWVGTRCRGVFDRATFKRWIGLPRDWIESGDVLLVGAPGFVGLAVRGECAVGAISSQVVLTLRGLA